MAHPLKSAEFRRLLDARLTSVFEEHAKKAELKSVIPTLFNVVSSSKAWEEHFYVTGVPDISEFSGKLAYLAQYPGFHKKIEHKEYAGGIAAERKLLEDKLYGVLERNSKDLVRSAMRVREKKGVRLLSSSDSSAFDYMTSEEGQPLCSSSHTVKTGVSTSSGFDNAGTTALSKTSVAAVRLLMRKFKTDIGERFEPSENLALVVPDNLADTAREIVGTDKGLDTGDGNINPQYQRHQVIPILRLDDTDTNDWWMMDLDGAKDSFVFYDRTKPDYNQTVDFDTYQLLQSVYMRISYGWLDWRSVYGSFVS